MEGVGRLGCHTWAPEDVLAIEGPHKARGPDLQQPSPGQQEPPDAALVVRLGSDRDSLELFYRRHVEAVTAFAARRCPGAGDVADVVSGTFLRAITGADTFDPRRAGNSARGWLVGIALNEIRDQARKNRRHIALVARVGGRRLLDESDVARIEQLIDAQRLAPKLDEALSQLSPGEREAVLLVAVDGLSSAEAAVALGLSSTVFRARLSRGKRHLRKCFTVNPSGCPEVIGVL